MKHSDFLVDLLNAQGDVIGNRPRAQINKQTDIYHVVFGLLKTEAGDIALCTIPKRDDLPNIYASLLGAPAATIKRTGETAQQAAARVYKAELGLTLTPKLVGEGIIKIDSTRTNYASVFIQTITELPKNFSKSDVGELLTLKPQEIDQTLSSERFAPTFMLIWQKYSEKL